MIIILKHLEVYGITLEMNNFLANGAFADFPATNNSSALFKFKTKIAGRTKDDGTKNVKTRLPLSF